MPPCASSNPIKPFDMTVLPFEPLFFMVSDFTVVGTFIVHDGSIVNSPLEVILEYPESISNATLLPLYGVPEFTPKYKINNITDFRKEVIDIMNLIPFGETITYNDIAETIAKKRRIKKMSAQAVGGAVGSNPICIIIPCHRVVGKNGKLTGYGGGIKNKEILLEHEQNNKM